MPDAVTVAGVTSEPVLTDDQRARGQALIIARDILAHKGGGPFSSVSLQSTSAFDVMHMAEYVLRGQVYLSDDDTSDEADTNEAPAIEPAEADDGVTFFTREERDAHGESVERYQSWNAQIGHRAGWAAARSYFTRDQGEAEQGEEGPSAYDRAVMFARDSLREQGFQGRSVDEAATAVVSRLSAAGLIH